MRTRWRILIVAVAEPLRGLRLATSELLGHPPLDLALLGARLLKLGAEVRVIDQNGERLTDRAVRREAQLWRADLVLVWSGGSLVADDPIPDERAMTQLLAGWSWSAPILAAGPLARHYGVELLKRLPRLAGVLVGTASEELVGRFDPTGTPGVGSVVDGELFVVPGEGFTDPDVLPAWHLLPLDAYQGRGPGNLRVAAIPGDSDDPGLILRQVRHAVHRAGARFLAFSARDLGTHRDAIAEMSRNMFGAAPGMAWCCRVRSDRIDPAFVLALSRGGCEEVLVVAPSASGTPAQAPMDDPARPRIEAAVDAIRVTGMSPLVEHIVGRPGHTRSILSAWQRWFKDRRIAVRPRVRLVHPELGADAPGLVEGRDRAGCWDNELTPTDVEKAVRMVGGEAQRALIGGRSW